MFSNAADLPRATNSEERKLIIETASKHNSDLNNPCIKEQKLSYKCLSDHNYDQSECTIAFANYKACRDFWAKVTRHRRSQGIKPALPGPDEREEIKAEYMRKFHGKS